MKVKNLIQRVYDIGALLEEEKIKLLNSPVGELHDNLSSCSDLLNEENDILKKLDVFKVTSVVEGNRISDLVRASELLRKKIDVLNTLKTRPDLSPAQLVSINEQIKNFQSTIDTLEINIMRCYWEMDILDE